MVTLFVIYALIAGAAGIKGYKSPLFGASGIILYIILQFPAAAMMRESSEWTQCIAAAIVSVVCVCGFIVLLPSQDARAEPKQSAVPYALIGGISLLCACGVGGLWFYVMSQGGGSQTVFLIGAGLLFSGALACFRLDRQQAAPSAADVLRTDARAPVLFLRSFVSDAARVKPWGSGLLPMFPDSLGQSFEEFLAPTMNEFGPFVALGNPDDYLPTLGANKVYQQDESWQETVLDLLKRAEIVILLEGTTPGLSWEISQVRQRCSPKSVFLITPTAKFPRAGWGEFVQILREAGFQLSDEDIGPGALVGFDDSFQPVVLCQGVSKASDYLQAIEKWHGPPLKDGNSKGCPSCGKRLPLDYSYCRDCHTWLN